MICSNYSIKDNSCSMGIPVGSGFVAYFCKANHMKCPYMGILEQLKGDIFSRRKSRVSEKIWKRP